MLIGHLADKLRNQVFTRPNEVIERDGFLRHPFKAALEFLPGVLERPGRAPRPSAGYG
jgi:hypothetical protein